jgi:NAD+ diphosphatase
MPDKYQPIAIPPIDRSEPALWFAFHRGELLIVPSTGPVELPCCLDLSELGLSSERSLYLGRYDGKHCYASELTATDIVPSGHQFQGLRAFFATVDEELAALAGRAFQIMEWDRNHRFCNRCGTPTEARADQRARICPQCGHTIYPPISPAVMILIIRGRELLLARRRGAPAGRYSALAGFVEPGEMLEDTVRRETREEVGVELKELRYFGSQPWPFPHSLMVAFTAQYAGGEVRPDGVEIEDARWFDVADLPNLPPSISISRRMITAVAKELAGERGVGN